MNVTPVEPEYAIRLFHRSETIDFLCVIIPGFFTLVILENEGVRGWLRLFGVREFLDFN